MGKLIGRETELSALAELVRRGERCITLVGPPGIGKTRLARAFSAAADSPSLFCELYATRDPIEACAMVASALDAMPRAEDDDLVTAVARALAGRGALLLILDNLEQLLPDFAKVVGAWLAAAPELGVVSTSRESLRLSHEHVFEVPPLPEAAELFIACARRARGRFEPNELERHTVAAIVARLEHMPLAVELAAARARALSVDEIFARLGERLELLDRGPRDRSARQLTMEGAIRWSWDLLDADERRALGRLSVCGHGFSFATAAALLDSDTAGSSMQLVEALRDKSLVRSRDDDDGTTRYDMLDTIRAFAAARLEETGEADAIRLRFAEHLLATAERALADGPSEPVLRSIDRERVHYERLLRGQVVRGSEETALIAIRAAVVLDSLAPDEGLAVRELPQLEAALATAADKVAERWIGRALTVRAALCTFTADFPGALQDCARALAIADAHDDLEVAAWARYRLGYVLASSGRLDEALESYARASRLFQRLDQHAGLARSMQQQAACLQSVDRAAEALVLLERCRALSRNRGFERIELRAEAGLGFHYLEVGDFDESMRHYQRCLDLARDVGAARTAMLVTGYVGLLCFDHDALTEALEHLSAAVAAGREVGDTRIEGLFLADLGGVHAARDEMPEAEAAFDRCDVLLESHPFVAAICAVSRGHLELARARRAASRGDLESWKRLRAAASRRADQARAVADGGRLVDRSDDARIAVRILERALGRANAPASSLTSSVERRPNDVVLFEGGGFAIDGGPAVDLSRRTTLRALLAALSEQHERDSGSAVSIDELLRAAWPGERIARSSALNRLHVALATLRALGLRSVIERVAEGYRIVPAVRVRRAP